MNNKMCPCPPQNGRPSCMPVASFTASSPCCPCVPGVPPVNCPPNCCPDTGCPRGYKPCVMTMTPPANCDPRGVWIATIEKCPPKPKRY
ncbi:hypothetical protein CBL_09903 [Carabus blaptoides fortunei]